MDLESECSVLDNDSDIDLIVNPESVYLADNHKTNNNGFCSNEISKLTTGENLDASALPADYTEENCFGNFQPKNSPPLAEGSHPVNKGFGLRKWRRIRRDAVKDSGFCSDTGKALKRGLTASVNPAKPSQLSHEGSVGSVNMAKHHSFVDGFAARGSSLDSRFADGTDSDNSEDRCSKSSTAASVPKAKYDLLAVSGNAWEKNKVKSLSGKNSGSSTQHVQQGKGLTESSKKHRGERVKIDMENSYSSMESDSRSTNFVFMQGSPTSNGKLNAEDHTIDHEEMQAGYSKDNAEEVEDVSPDDSAADLSWEAEQKNSENHQPSTQLDPLVESVHTLQSVQEALERELEKFEEIRKEYTSLGNNASEGSRAPADLSSADQENFEPGSSDQMGYAKTRQGSSSLENQVLKLTQNVKHLESELEQTRAMLRAKNLRVVEIEATLDNSRSPMENSCSKSYIQLQQEMETQIECLMKEKMEAEIECMVIAMEAREYRIPAIFEEQKALAEQQAEVMHKLGETENKAKTIKKQAEKLDKFCSDLLGTEEIFMMKWRVCRDASCFFIQLIMLISVLWLFAPRFAPRSGVVVPT